MHLVSQVVFNYNIERVLSGDSGIFNDDAELQAAVQKMFNGEMMSVDVTRTVNIIDKDQLIYPDGISRYLVLTDKKYQQHKTFEIGQETLRLYVVDRIWYPSHVRDYLMSQYNSVLDFKPKNKKTPICDFHIIELDGPIAINKTTGRPYSKPVKHVAYREATKSDIIVDKNLNQIWPKKTGKMPVALTELLAKKTEKVYEG